MNKILENIVLPFGDFLNNSSFVKELKYWRKLDKFSEKELKDLQSTNLKSMLLHTVKNVPKFKNVKLVGKNPEKWIQSFPILIKDNIRNEGETLISDLSSSTDLISYSSSGSSGIQTTVYMNKKEQSIIRAILIHWWEWTGYKIGDPIAQTGMSPNRSNLKRIKDFLFKTIYIEAFSLSSHQLESLCKNLNNTSKYYLVGYASSLNIIAEYSLKKNYQIKFKSVISLGDKLFDHYKKNIENAFKTKVYDTYGCNEGFLIASQKDLEYKYIMSPHVYLEILDDDDKPVKDGELGNVVVTRLDCYSMPLIRYKIGDLAIKLPKEKYPAKREFNYPLLQKIVGRETDVIYLTDGKKMVVHSFTGIFEYIPEIKQFQVIQNKKDAIIIKYIKSTTFKNEVLPEITKKLQGYIKDPKFTILFEEVNDIAPSKSGKPQIIINNIKK